MATKNNTSKYHIYRKISCSSIGQEHADPKSMSLGSVLAQWQPPGRWHFTAGGSPQTGGIWTKGEAELQLGPAAVCSPAVPTAVAARLRGLWRTMLLPTQPARAGQPASLWQLAEASTGLPFQAECYLKSQPFRFARISLVLLWSLNIKSSPHEEELQDRPPVCQKSTSHNIHWVHANINPPFKTIKMNAGNEKSWKYVLFCEAPISLK